MKLNREYYQYDNVVEIAEDLIGKTLCTNFSGRLCKGIIIEAEAYNGRTDRASHAYGNRLTKRTKTMYLKGGVSYIYLCYGIHNLFNVVTNKQGLADAVLIRALEPIEGIDAMIDRRSLPKVTPNFCKGPGNLTVAMGINREQNGVDLCGESIWLEDEGWNFDVESTPRIGVDYAGEDALLPWRFIKK